jgi:hypothetical protein
LGSCRCSIDGVKGRIPRLARSSAGKSRRIQNAEKLQAIVDLDLDELLAIEPPRGYGRD